MCTQNMIRILFSILALCILCMATSSSEREMVAAIDFGTTYSAFAFASKNDFSPTYINEVMNKTRTTTSILFNENKEFHSFGYEADKKYEELSIEKERKEWYYFRRFKMLLLKTTENGSLNIKTKLKTGDFSLEGEDGREMLAIEVFSESIKYLKNRALEQMNQHGDSFTAEDVKWVLTVPAIWDDAAKQFMRIAADKAGIENLVLALEPEAAALSYKYLQNESKMDSEDVFSVNSTYVVLHVGDGIDEIVSHEVQMNGLLKELTIPVGGDWGGVQVDRAFYQLLIKLFGKGLIQELKQNNYHDFLWLMETFEDEKFDVSGEGDDKLELMFPHVNTSTIEQLISQNNFTGQIGISNGKLVLYATLLKSLFSESLDDIKNATVNMLKEDSVKNSKTILLVGDFAKSILLQNSIKSEFKNKDIITPADPSLAVVKGAVIFGHMPNIVVTRICKVTYGIHIYPLQKDPANPGTFTKLAEIGESLTVGTKRTINLLDRGQNQNVSIYTCTNKNPKDVSHSGCTLLGHLVLDRLSAGTKKIAVTMIFGDTEIRVEATDLDSDTKVHATLDFL